MAYSDITKALRGAPSCLDPPPGLPRLNGPYAYLVFFFFTVHHMKTHLDTQENHTRELSVTYWTTDYMQKIKIIIF